MEDAKTFLFGDLTDRILACAYRVHDVLGAGFLEKVYENSLAIEIGKAGMKVKQQYPLNVYYEGNIVGEYFADLLVEDKVIVELKIADEISRVHYMQIYNYLRASGLRVGLVLGFGDKGVAVRRVDML